MHTPPIVFFTKSAKPSPSFLLFKQHLLQEIQALSAFNPSFLAAQPVPRDLLYCPQLPPNTAPLHIIPNTPPYHIYQSHLPSAFPHLPNFRTQPVQHLSQLLSLLPHNHLFPVNNPRFSSTLSAPLTCFHLHHNYQLNPYALLLHELSQIASTLNDILSQHPLPHSKRPPSLAPLIYKATNQTHPSLSLSLLQPKSIPFHITLSPHPTTIKTWSLLYTPEPSPFPKRLLSSLALWNHLLSTLQARQGYCSPQNPSSPHIHIPSSRNQITITLP